MSSDKHHGSPPPYSELQQSRIMKPTVDYSLYLVSDQTPAVLGTNDILQVAEAALKGGVTIVQYREKKADTGEQIKVAKELHAICKKYNVPLVINDRVDVALAVGCEGVHIGQDDMDLKTARKLLGDDAIIGVTVASIKEALIACEDGADYLGIGTIFATPTKANAKDIIGTAGCRAILSAMEEKYSHVGTVCIGGLNRSNIQRVLYQSRAEKKGLDGIALVSAIVSADDPEKASKNLLHLIKTPPPFEIPFPQDYSQCDINSILDEIVPSIIAKIASENPLSHNMTNLVVQNFAANVALAIGASPIMANVGEEALDLCKLGGALVINMGTATEEGIANYLTAVRAYNQQGAPVVFDPVGAAATDLRRKAVKTLMDGGYYDCIKGNEGEIRQVVGQVGVEQRGVDSGKSTLNEQEKAQIVRDLARRERNIIVMTGSTDYISDGVRTFGIRNGAATHLEGGRVTGSGCVLGTTISAALAATLTMEKPDKLIATLAALLLFEIAAERAEEREDVKGPGSFVPALIDELDQIRLLAAAGAGDWTKQAKVAMIDV